MDANSPVMQAWMELLAGMDEAMGQELFDKVKALIGGETPETPAPEMEQKTAPFAVQAALTKEEVQAMITDAIAGITAPPVATMPAPVAPTEGMLTAGLKVLTCHLTLLKNSSINARTLTRKQQRHLLQTLKQITTLKIRT